MLTVAQGIQHLPRYQAASNPTPDATRSQRHKQKDATDHPLRVSLDIVPGGYTPISQRQGYAPWRDIRCQRHALFCGPGNQAISPLSQSGQVFIHGGR